MRKNSLTTFPLLAGVFLVAFASPSFAAKVGDPAPGFGPKDSVRDSHGKTQSLKQYAGKFVVLEWHNQGCPFVKKHYETGNMQKLQKEWTAKGVVWLTVISSAKGKQGAVTDKEANDYVTKMKASPTAVLMDSAGEVGKAYDAKTTPQMAVIDPKGILIYEGAIDDKATPDKADVAKAKNYVSAALGEAMAGKKVSVAATNPYGCAVKYE